MTTHEDTPGPQQDRQCSGSGQGQLLPGLTHYCRQSRCAACPWAGPAPKKGALAGKRHAGRIERTGKRLTDLSRLSTCRGEGKRKGGEKERKRKVKLDPQHPRSFWSSPTACTSPSAPETHSQLAQGWEHTGQQGHTQTDQSMPPPAPQNRPGCPGQPGPCPLPTTQCWGTVAAPGRRGRDWRLATRSSQVGSLQRWELLPREQGKDGAVQGSRASLCPAQPGSQGTCGTGAGWRPQRSHRLPATTNASECPAMTAVPCPTGLPTG